MVSLVDSGPARNCQGFTRRGLLSAGSLSLAGLACPEWLAARVRAASVRPSFIRDKAVLFVFLSGGPTQYETFSPNMHAPDPYRSTRGEIATRLTGVTFGSDFPLLADLAERGLADRVLVVVTGEFGRTGKLQGNGGRNHWAELCPLLLIGGGLPRGQVLGQHDRQNAVASGEVVTLSHLIGTIFHTLFDIGQLRLERGVPATLSQFLAQHAPHPHLAAR